MKNLQLNEALKVLVIWVWVFVPHDGFCAQKETSFKSSQKFSEENQIIDKAILQKGGNLLIIPFKAGAGVPADEETNRISLMFVKGMTESFDGSLSSLKIISSDYAQDANFIVKGYIIKLAQSQGVKRWLPGAKKIELGLEGKIIDQKTNLVLYHFSRNQTINGEEKDFKSLAYIIGKEVGQFVSHLQ